MAGVDTPLVIVRTQCLPGNASATVRVLATRFGTYCIRVGALVLIETPPTKLSFQKSVSLPLPMTMYVEAWKKALASIDCCSGN